MKSKRAFDVFASGVGLVLLAPALALVALAIRLQDGGPAFFRQERVGRSGRLFRIWKFRTMVRDAERLGPQLTVGRDRRITRLGAILRAAKLDELPQLLNVLRGEMSLVGPRPEVPRYVRLYSQEQRRVLMLLPGVTDPASLAYRNEARLLADAEDSERLYIERIVPDKISMNLAYAHRATLLSDVGVIFRTLLGLGPPTGQWYVSNRRERLGRQIP